MKTTNHTPGTWHLTLADYDAAIHSDVTIARIEDEASAWVANAHLIAAAPDLLSALEEMMSVFQDHEQYDEESAEVVSIARAAIAKAKGKHDNRYLRQANSTA